MISTSSISKGASIQRRNLIFEGNSLFANSAGALFSHGLPKAIWTAVSTTTLAFRSYDLPGRSSTQINNSIPDNIIPIIKGNDIIVYWEGTNQMGGAGTSGADTAALVQTYYDTVRAYGAKLIVCGVIARDKAGDAADLMDRIDAFNLILRTTPSTYCNAYVDLGALPEFNTRADCSNATYYETDLLHIKVAAQDIVQTNIVTAINTLL